MRSDKCNSCGFLENLHQEKMFHKQTRHEYVKQKIIFIVSLFGIGKTDFLGLPDGGNIALIYMIPVISVIYDLFLFAEDYKVKRVGAFLRDVAGTNCDKIWEDNLSRCIVGNKSKRDNFAEYASFILSILAIIISFFLVISCPKGNCLLSIFWFPSCFCAEIVLFRYARKIIQSNSYSCVDIEGDLRDCEG